ncbi:hypothetical protein QJS10_CPB14g00823 [Acorus calamus]|uniref:Uncharacterized protein n=1 Tax=Acorus calamus TaxID=4465 RepID=A0AAV9DCH7_ACOCL|nr:hypothetical protein QJS10_CPB14g00823 [Acorus calamus]
MDDVHDGPQWNLRNVDLGGLVNTLKLADYGEGSTLVDWSFEVAPVVGLSEEAVE